MQDLSKITIETERLNLIPISTEYAEDIFREFNEALTVYMFSQPCDDIAGTKAFIDRCIGHGEKGKGITLVIIDKEEKNFLGMVSLDKLEEEIPEFGVWVQKSAHGNLYGREAVGGLKLWIDQNLDYEILSYPCVAENTASRKIPESLGGKVIAEWEMDFQGVMRPTVEYHISK